ncbi:MAG: sensor histidine kinase [Lachnospiraceae bacterium]|nr:sensor histidine kinase [Lachnospiraceae bacterium]
MGLFSLLFGRAIDKRIAGYQNELMTKHCDEVQNIYRTMRGWRHDYHNHIQAMKVLTIQMRENGRNDEPLEQLEEYLNKLNDDLTAVDTVVKTGNVMVDAILNSKLSLMKAKKLPVNVKASVPASFPISEVDLCAVIGNLLDNAMEACERQQAENERFIRVYIGVLKQHLYISVSNSVSGGVKKAGKRYLSTKRSANHGYGLMRIDRIAAKYHGYVNRQNEEGVFVTEVMLPL